MVDENTKTCALKKRGLKFFLIGCIIIVLSAVIKYNFFDLERQIERVSTSGYYKANAELMPYENGDTFMAVMLEAKSSEGYDEKNFLLHLKKVCGKLKDIEINSKDTVFYLSTEDNPAYFFRSISTSDIYDVDWNKDMSYGEFESFFYNPYKALINYTYKEEDTSGYIRDGKKCIGYRVIVDENATDEELLSVFRELTHYDGYYLHTVWFYRSQKEIDDFGFFTVALLDEVAVGDIVIDRDNFKETYEELKNIFK